ncbi:MAG: S-layer homology domain-containing protein [Oscillospiraceae bacterium]|nr:S-layer homology domain-containing protein [Oscillospiraceae bacterium]
MQPVKRILSLILMLSLCIQLMPAPARADMSAEPAAKPVEITTAEGESIAVEESWEEAYPYGAFLFANGQASLTEGGEAVLIPVYRLGGAGGRATAYLYYSPASIALDENTQSSASAAGYGDIRIEVEDALPIAAYQPVGKDPDPEPTDAKLNDAPYAGEDAEEGDRVLTVDVQADSWQWYIRSQGAWEQVEDATVPDFIVPAEFLDEYDFRCVYTVDGVSYCTDSRKGEVYVKPEPEALPEIPEDLDLSVEQSFTELELDPEDPCASYVFALTFADGEWVKYLRITAPEDTAAEVMKFAAFTLLDCEGGTVLSQAATLTLTVEDNDPAEPFTIGFTQDSYPADRADGAAYLYVKRTGGAQTMVTLDYTVEDDTAVAGVDYLSVTGTAVFYADIDEAVIAIPLITDASAGEERSFRVVLGEMRGDGAGLGTLGRTEAEVVLTGSADALCEGENLVTLLYDASAVDASGSVTEAEQIAAPVDGGTVTGTQVAYGEEDYIRGEIAGMDFAPEPGADEAGLMTYDYGTIRFTAGSAGAYWSDRVYIAGRSGNDIKGWTQGSAYGNGWQLKGKSPATARLVIPNMAQMYSGFRGQFEYSLQWASGWTQFWYGDEFIYGAAYLANASGSSQYDTYTQKAWVDGDTAYYYPGWSASSSWGMDSNNGSLVLALWRYDAHDGDSDAYSRITEGYLTRRVFDSTWSLLIHTANDGESGGRNVVTAPDGAARLSSATNVYDSMKPKITVVPGAGGVDGWGRLYVGSQIQVELQTTDSYKPLTGEVLNTAVYLTRTSDGSIVSEPGLRIEQNGDTYTVTMFWDKIKESDLSTDYTVNVVMTRSQRLVLDLSPSVPRKGGGGEDARNIDTGRIAEAWKNFWASGESYITLGCSLPGSTAPHFSKQITEKRVEASGAVQDGSASPMFDLGEFQNVQYINFNRNGRDRIVYNGKIYKGNDRIWLTVEDLAFARVDFSYYSEEYLAAESLMSVKVNRAEVYFDGDGDGRIAGRYNAETGYFNLDAGTADRFVMLLDPDASYDESLFQPVKLNNGKYGEYILKLYYTMTPRSLSEPLSGAKNFAQVLPAFTTSVTDHTVYSSLTEEQRSYRYILPALGADGGRTSDGHVMYGAEATAVQFVDVPLGGDRSPVEHEGDEDTGYTYHWSPDFHGGLIYPFADPEPIYIAHSLAGENIPLAKTELVDGAVRTDSAGKANLNGYLGSFVADTTVALCVREQKQTADELKANPATAQTLECENTGLSGRSASPDSSYLSEINTPSMGADEMDISGDLPFSELIPNFGKQLFMQTTGLMNYITVMVKKDEVMVTVSIPVLTGDETGIKGKFPKVMGQPGEKAWGAAKDLLTKDAKAYKDAFKKDAYNKGGNTLKSEKWAASLNVVIVLYFKYDTVTNAFYFKEFALGMMGSVSFRFTARLAVCPFVYFFVAVTASLMVTTGGTVVHKERERELAFVDADAPLFLSRGKSFQYTTKYQNLNIQFNGKVYIDVRNSETDTEPMSGSIGGYMNSDGGKKIRVDLSTENGTEFSGEKVVRVVALEDTTISYLNVIEGVDSKMVWSGVNITPKVVAELGAGVGIDFLKLEVFFRLILAPTVTFGVYNKDTGDYDAADITSALLSLALSFRVVLVFFSYEMDLVGIKATMSNKKWSFAWTKPGEDVPLQSDSGLLRLPEDNSATARIYSPRNPDEAALTAYDADDPAVPFQLSGYNSSVSAFRLSDGLSLGYDYQVIPVNGENYVLYTYARPDSAGALDNSMLVLSRLISTGGVGSVGLVNPLDERKPAADAVRPEPNNDAVPDNWRATPYIPVDTDGAGTDDGTGDLEFRAWLDPDGKTIRVAWVSYAETTTLSGDENADAVLQEAVRNTVVKTASFDTTTKDGFTAAQTVSGQEDSHVSMPQPLDEHVTAYVQAEHFTAEERAAASSSFARALAAVGYDPDAAGTSDEARAQREMGQYRLKTQEMLWDTAGKRSSICVSVDGAVTRRLLPEGQTVDNVEFVRSGNTCYAAYTTRELRYTDAAGNSVPAERAQNILTVRRLFLSAFTVGSDGKVAWGSEDKSVLLRTLYDFDDNTVLQDGIYSGGSITPYEEPYFGNLQFLNAALGDALAGQDESFELMAEAEDFLLFEMNGCTYVIRQESLERITGAEHKGTIIPFFAPDPSLTETAEQASAANTGRTEVTIGADGDGGLAAVYVGTVPETGNNALYLSKYDAITGAWGKGVILAMNHMDVYEDAIAENWDSDEARSAYLGQREGYDKGGMDQFTFTAPHIALGVKATASAVSETNSAVNSSAGDNAGAQTTLLILTQGNLRYLTTVTDSSGQSYLAPDPKGSGKYPAGIGLYAISYGAGHQTVGEAALSFSTRDFTTGADLYTRLSFVNTGDVGIRGSKGPDQAVTVTLSVEAENISDTKLISWTVTENIVPGQKVELDGSFNLPVTLPEGAQFNLSVSEGSHYERMGGKPFSAVLPCVLRVESKPELGFEEASAALAGQAADQVVLDEKGNAVVEMDFLAGNRGNANATGVYAQFSYDTGAWDENGDPVYAALDISDNTLAVGEEEQLAVLQEGQTAGDLKNGILYLGALRAGFGRRVRGTVTLSPDQYFVAHTHPEGDRENLQNYEGLALRVELFSDADSDVTTDAHGVRQAVHGEYNTGNNRFHGTVAPAVSFVIPDQLLLSVGNMLRLPVSYVSATGSGLPQIQVEEYPDKEDLDANPNTRIQNMDQNLDRLYYEAGSYGAGRGTGTLVVRAAKEGSGYIRVLDQRTNSYRDIPFTVVGTNMGTDIGPDYGRFTFYHADGTKYAKGDSTGNQSWRFATGVESWKGAGSSDGDKTPYRKTLMEGKKGAYFTFETQAQSIMFSFRGFAEISSDFPGFQPVSIASMKEIKTFDEVQVFFGPNPENAVHTVTVRVDYEESASFDRIIEQYYGDANNLDDKLFPPMVYWSANFPKPYSIYGEYASRQISVNIIGSVPLAALNVTKPDLGGRGYYKVFSYNITQKSSNWWVLNLSILGNYTFQFEAVDQNGQHKVEKVDINWYNPSWDARLMEDGSPAALPDGVTESSDGRRWMTAAFIPDPKSVIRVTVDESAPYEDILILAGDAEVIAGYVEAEDGLGLLSVTMPGTRGNEYDIPVRHDGMYAVIAYSFDPLALLSGYGSEYDYQIISADGTAEEHNVQQEDEYAWNAECLLVEGVVPVPEIRIVMFDTQGGTEVPFQEVEEGKTATRPADPTRAGYRFNGWLLDGKPYDFSAPVTETIVLIASWTPRPSGYPTVTSGGSGETSPTPPPSETEAPLTEAEKDALLDRYADLDRDAWYRDGVAWALRRGLMNGTGERTFDPDGETSRAMLVTVLWRMEGSPAAETGAGGGTDFADVPEGEWYTDAVRWAAANGIVSGYGDGSFGPGDAVTREQLAAILYRYAGTKGAGGTEAGPYPLNYADAEGVSDWAVEAMGWLTAQGVIQGVGGNRISPKTGATRAQAATMLMRYDGLM